MIVAFPGETNKQFNNTLKVVKEIGFDQINTAAYSPRPNTPASLWGDQLAEDIKVERLRELNYLVEETAREQNARYKNSIEEILAEKYNPKDPCQLMGRTRTNRLTFFPKQLVKNKTFNPGDLVKVMIKEIRPFSLTGIPINLNLQ